MGLIKPDDFDKNAEALYTPPEDPYSVTPTATVGGNAPDYGQNNWLTESHGRVQSDLTDRGARYSPIANNHGADAIQFGAYGSDVGSFDYQKEIWKQQMYESGGWTPQVDPAAGNIGGREGWADDYDARMTAAAGFYADRQAPDFNFYNPDMAGYEESVGQAGQSRDAFLAGQAHTAGDLGMMSRDLGGIRAMAAGLGQSAAEMAMQRQSEDAFQQNLAAAASARGAGANSALLQAAQQNAVGQGQLTRDLGIQRASEQQGWVDALLRGTDSYMGAQDAYVDNYAGLYDQDQAAAQMQGDMAMQYAQTMADQEAVKFGGDVDTMNANDSMVQFFLEQGLSVQEAQQRAALAFQALQTGNVLQNKGIDMGAPQEQTTGDQILAAGLETGGYVAGKWLTGGS